jgi:zinc transporter 1/2/3
MADDAHILFSLKVAYIFIIFLVPYVALIPALSQNCRKSEKTLGVMNAFAGGVFLAMALIHILPESAETYNDVMNA